MLTNIISWSLNHRVAVIVPCRLTERGGGAVARLNYHSLKRVLRIGYQDWHTGHQK